MPILTRFQQTYQGVARNSVSIFSKQVLLSLAFSHTHSGFIFPPAGSGDHVTNNSVCAERKINKICHSLLVLPNYLILPMTSTSEMTLINGNFSSLNLDVFEIQEVLELLKNYNKAGFQLMEDLKMSTDYHLEETIRRLVRFVANYQKN